MNETASTDFGNYWDGCLLLSLKRFEQINTLPHGSTVALLVVLAASLSQVVAQSVILFINRVKPVLCFQLADYSLVCVWLHIPGSEYLADQFRSIYSQSSFWCCGTHFRFSYAPLIFSLFGAMPYFGEPLLSLLSLWHLLAMVVFAGASNTNVWQAFGTVALGWVTLLVMQRTIGQPIANSVAGCFGGRCRASY